MGKVLLIETSDFTVRCEPLSSGIRESTDKTGMMILKGHTEKSQNATVGRTKILISRDLELAAPNFSVSPKGVPATILDKENANGRRYTKKEMQKAICKARENKLFENCRLLCTADDHPQELFPAPINSSHMVIDAYTKTIGEDTILMNDWLVLNTSKGKDL